MNKKAAEQQRAVRSMETPEQYSEFEDSVIEAAKTQAQRIIDDARRQGDANFDKLMEGHRGDPLIPYREEAEEPSGPQNGLGQAGQPQKAAGVPRASL